MSNHIDLRSNIMWSGVNLLTNYKPNYKAFGLSFFFLNAGENLTFLVEQYLPGSV